MGLRIGNWWAALAILTCASAQVGAIGAAPTTVGYFRLITAVAEGDAAEGAAESPVVVEHDEAGHVILHVPSEVQERIGLKVTQVAAVTRDLQARAYGLLEADPAHAFTLRAPVGGFLRTVNGAPWPALGQRVTAGTEVGAVQPRFTAAESFDLVSRWTEANAEVTQLTAELEAANASLVNKRTLNAGGGLVSDRAVEETEALVKGTEARLTSARKRAEIIEGLIGSTGNETKPFVLCVAIAGRIDEVAASVGECVESGQALLRVIDLIHLIARVSLPASAPAPALDRDAQIVIMGSDDRVLPAPPEPGVEQSLAAEERKSSVPTPLAASEMAPQLSRARTYWPLRLEVVATPV